MNTSQKPSSASQSTSHLPSGNEHADVLPPEALGGDRIQNASTFKQIMGVRVSEWAREKEFCPALVYSVVSGQRKCLRGMSFQIAKELGMK